MVEALRHGLRMTFLSWGTTIGKHAPGCTLLSVDVAPQDNIDKAICIWQELSHDRRIIQR